MVVMKEDFPSSFPEPFLNQGNEVADIRKKSSIFRLSKRVPNAPPYFIFLSLSPSPRLLATMGEPARRGS